MNKDMNQRIDQLREGIIASTQELIKIRSVKAAAEEGMPFGSGVNEALEKALKIAADLGLETKNVDGYAGFTEIGEGEEMLAVLCHLDVVPEGKDWTYPPYGGEVHDGKIYGRGSVDNKGPAAAALYALKAIKDEGIKLKKRVRVILGTDEESGWEGLNYYLEHEEVPDYAFSPDAEFPVIFGEKGILSIKLKMEPTEKGGQGDPVILSVEGGNAPNMVPDYCEARLQTADPAALREKLNKFSADNGYKLELVNEGGEEDVHIKSHGISAHGSLPQDGRNAVSQLVKFLASLDIADDEYPGRFIDFYDRKIGLNYYGELLGCDLQDDVSGRLTFNVGMIKMTGEGGEIIVDIRYPVTSSKEEVLNKIQGGIKDYGVLLEERSHMAPLYVPEDDPLVKKLMKVYRELTGDDSGAVTMGGGTYARAVEKAVAFGPLFPGQPELAHQRDEYIGIDDLILNAKIYASAIIEMAGE